MSFPSLKTLLKDVPTEEQIVDILINLRKQDDRSIVVVGASYLDEALRRMLATYLRTLTKPQHELLFGQNQPLSSFSAKIKLSYALELIGPETLHDLDLIREIRNVFAHNLRPIDFSNASVSAACSRLKFSRFSRSSADSAQMYCDVLRYIFVGCSIKTLRFTDSFKTKHRAPLSISLLQ